MIQKSLTDGVLQQRYIEKWDGKLPNVLADGGSSDVVIPVMPNDFAKDGGEDND